MKIKGVEQFKQIQQVLNQNFQLLDYRIQSTFVNKKSEFSEILNLITFQELSIEDSLLISKKIINNDIQVSFEKPGLELGINPLYLEYGLEKSNFQLMESLKI